jgi:hypothetical protein
MCDQNTVAPAGSAREAAVEYGSSVSARETTVEGGGVSLREGAVGYGAATLGYFF